MTSCGGGSTHVILTGVYCSRVGGAVLALIIVGGPRLMGLVSCASPPPTYFRGLIDMICIFLSADIIMYFGVCGGGTGIRMTDDGRWHSRCAMMTNSTTNIPRHWAVGISISLSLSFSLSERNCA